MDGYYAKTGICTEFLVWTSGLRICRPGQILADIPARRSGAMAVADGKSYFAGYKTKI